MNSYSGFLALQIHPVCLGQKCAWQAAQYVGAITVEALDLRGRDSQYMSATKRRASLRIADRPIAAVVNAGAAIISFAAARLSARHRPGRPQSRLLTACRTELKPKQQLLSRFTC